MIEANTETPPINPEWLERMQRTKPEFLRELFSVFLVEEPKRLAAIEAAVDQRDLERVRHLAHSLKGAAATLGMGPLSDAARTLELAAKDASGESQAALQAATAQLREQMRRVIQKISQ